MKTTFHRISIATIAVSALLFSAVPAHAVLTMSDLAAGGSFTSGKLIYSDFSFTTCPTNIGSASFDLGACPVVGVADNGIKYDQYFLPGTDPNQFYRQDWYYKVTTIDPNDRITGTVCISDSGMGTSGGTGWTYVDSHISFSNAVGDIWGEGYLDNAFGGGYFPTFAGQSELYFHAFLVAMVSSDFDGGTSFSMGNPTQTFTVEAIPEPATALLFGLGGMGAWILRRNKKKVEDDDDIA